MSRQLLDELQAHGKRHVRLEVVRQCFQRAHPELNDSPTRSQALFAALNALAAEGAIVFPAKRSWERIGNPPLPTFVKLPPKAPAARFDYRQVPWLPELAFWVELPDSRLPDLLRINEFLLRRRGTLRLAPIKERSLQIFGDEKRLDELRTGETLFGRRLRLDGLGAFVAVPPLAYRAGEAPGRPLLVVENYSAYWSFGEWNAAARRYAAVVYGSGKEFRSGNRRAALGRVLVEIQGLGIEYLGDIDPEGIAIPVDFNLAESDGCRVVPALRFYAWLLKAGVRRPLAERAQAERAQSAKVHGWLPPALAQRVNELFAAGFWIPQESLGLEALEQQFSD